MKMVLDEGDEPDINMAPMIDMVFLLLVYFMVAASLIRSEADLSIRLPGMLSQSQDVSIPDEQMIEVKTEGHVILNGREFDSTASSQLPELTETLTRYRQSCQAAGIEALITIDAAPTARHQRVIDVMNACAGAGIEGVSFSAGGEES